jgi:hypothetical protein
MLRESRESRKNFLLSKRIRFKLDKKKKKRKRKLLALLMCENSWRGARGRDLI